MTNPSDTDIRWTQAFLQKISEDQKAIMLVLPDAFMDARAFQSKRREIFLSAYVSV